ncbi:hypothetical protein BGZ46_000283 [Entomortierella lignicola]|nr:hypothetical protein BGZ46_000283 [Entomortierella lignicola]
MTLPTCQALAQQSCLPEECLTMIFHHLSYDRSTLHSLLQVNHQFFRLVVPTLYRSPFRLLESKAELWSWSDRTQRQVLLLQLFLHSAQIKQLDRTELRQQRQSKRQPKSQDCYFTCRPSNAKPIESEMNGSTTNIHTFESSRKYINDIISTKPKRRQRWWTKRRYSFEETPSILTFPALALSKKESNVATVVAPEKVQGNLTIQDTIMQSQQIQDSGLNFQRANILHVSNTYQSQSFWNDTCDESKSTTIVLSRPSPFNNSLSKNPIQFDMCMDPNQFQEPYLGSDSRDTLSRNDHYSMDESSDDLSINEDAHHRSHNCVSSYLSNRSDDDNDDDEDFSEDDTPLLDSIFSIGLSSLQPCLGPFRSTRENTSAKNWTQTWHQQLRGIRDDSSKYDDNGQTLPPHTRVQLMTDYLSYYIEHDHTRLARMLPAIFPNFSAESFDQLSTVRTFPRIDSLLDDYPSSRFPVLNFFQSLQQSHKNAQNLRQAHLIRTMVERELLNHSPQGIRSLSISASRIQDIICPPNRRSRLSSLRSRSDFLNQTLVSPLTSLISLLSTSPFSKAIPPSSSSSSLHSSASSSSVFSSLSSHSTASSSFTANSFSWSDAPPFCKLTHLHRIELYDIHHGIDVEAVVEFLRLHDQSYNTIREIKVGGPDDLGRSSHPDLVQILQCLKTVKVLDMIEWREAIRYLNQIPTSHLQTLLLGNVRMATMQHAEPPVSLSGDLENGSNGSLEDEEGDRQHPQVQALQSCRKLRELRMPVLIEGLFEWAVYERRQKVEASPSSRSILYTSSLEKAPPYWDHGREPLVQLENVHLSGTGTGPLISTLVHVVDAFRDSIQVLQSNSWIDSTEVLTCCLSLSWTWCLPHLQLLDLQGEISYRLRIQSLQYCPLLRILRLTLPYYAIPASSLGPVDPSLACRRWTCQSGGIGEGECTSCGLQLQPLTLADCFSSFQDDNINSASRQQCTVLFPRLQELKLVGDWNLEDRSLLRIAKVMPRLTQLSLLRCESQRLTARGMACALPSLCLKDQDRLRSLEVSKTWQSELEEVLADQEIYKSFIAGEGYPLELIYQ